VREVSKSSQQILLKIANNILNSSDPKFRTLKASNAMLKNKVLSAKGGHDYMIAVRVESSVSLVHLSLCLLLVGLSLVIRNTVGIEATADGMIGVELN